MRVRDRGSTLDVIAEQLEDEMGSPVSRPMFF
jgi:hypothetical protein